MQQMMKNLLIIIMVVISFKGFAQDPQLLDNMWYLQNVVIDGIDNLPPVNSEVTFITADFFENEFFTAVCDAISGSITYDASNPEFTLNCGMTLGGCNLSENSDFQAIYLDNFYFSHMVDVFSYTIITNGNGIKTLTVINSSGDEALYSNELLSTQELSSKIFLIYPNPVEDKLFISVSTDLTDLTANIFNVLGELIISINDFDFNYQPIDVHELTSGIYFIGIENSRKQSDLIQFIKN